MKRRKNNFSYDREPKKRKLSEAPDSTLLAHGHFPRHNSEDMKNAVRRAMGPKKAAEYFSILKQFFCAKLSKWELDYMFRDKIGVQYVGVHNEFLTKILYNARCHELPERYRNGAPFTPCKIPPTPGEAQSMGSDIPPAPDPPLRKKKKRPRLQAPQKPHRNGTVPPSSRRRPSIMIQRKPKPPPPPKPPFILKTFPKPTIKPNATWPTEKRTWIPQGELPTAYELHTRIDTNCKQNKVELDARVPLLIRAAMNAHLARFLRKMPVRKRKRCWCDLIDPRNRLASTVETFREHWVNCSRKQNVVNIREVQSVSFPFHRGKESI